MNINVKIIGTPDSLGNSFAVHLDNSDETVGDVKKKVASNLELRDSSTIQLIFAGQFLSNDQQLVRHLELGPATFLNVLIANLSINNVAGPTETDERDQTIENLSAQEQRHWRARFFVYCKFCNEVTPGKLRVRCSICKSSAVVVKKEPNTWNDILSRNMIRGQCLENGCVGSASSDIRNSLSHIVEFYFKCARCSNEEGAVPLTQVKPVRQDRDPKTCSICDEAKLENDLMVIFSCESAHATCLDCFIAYATEKLERRGFVMHPQYGYTLACPEPRCRDGFIGDAHHFRILGDTKLYDMYHRLAAEIYLLGEGGVYCPKPDCGEAFIFDSTFDSTTPETSSPASSLSNEPRGRKLVLCPKCEFVFCFYCRYGASECHCTTVASNLHHLPATVPTINRISLNLSVNDELRSFVTIRSTTKSCPNCRAPTEKNEGCNHMTCVQCSPVLGIFSTVSFIVRQMQHFFHP